MRRKGLVMILFITVIFAISGCGRAVAESNNNINTEMSHRETQESVTATEEETTPTATEPATLPPVPKDDDYVKIIDYIPDIIIDLRYATPDNFTGQVIYDFKEGYLRYGTVKKLAAVQEQLKKQGFRLKIWDAYRPFSAQEKLWEVYPDGRYVANPAYGMRAHNLGGTVDITMVSLDGTDIDMPTEFDNFSLLADRDYSDIDNTDAVKNVMILQQTMYDNGFVGEKAEWWDYTDTTSYEAVDFKPES
ncbi:MAG: M15 family metallopeptidase [Lachnospira sp.]